MIRLGQPQLVLLNVLLVGVALASLVYVARQVGPKLQAVTPRPAPVSTLTVSAPVVPWPAPPPGAGNHGVIVSRNLFSPTRMETAPQVRTPGLPPAQRPNLYGVVLGGGAPVAYLEDPATRRVAGYRTGDILAGGTIRLITADHVLIARPEGVLEVRLDDPAKPGLTAPGPALAPGQGRPLPEAVPQPGGPPLEGGRRLPKEG